MAARERCKSLMILNADVMKKGFQHLAELLYRECRIPQTDLVFFMTFEELGRFVRNHDGAAGILINKAVRRLRNYKQAFDLQFAEVSRGTPKAFVQTAVDYRSSSDLTSRLSGMPVCRGRVKGRACVLKSLADADTIQNGDILIVRFTDIGWTPLFPLIGGLVTELGGLLSHGATIAREYGLPCIVNSPGATSIFRTGELVVLDSCAGYIEKIATD